MAVTAFAKLVLLALAVSSYCNAQCSSNTDPLGNITPVVASGWKWAVVASNLLAPRSIAFDSAGRLLVIEKGYGLSALELTPGPGTCVKERSRKTVLYLPKLNHGLTFAVDSKTIYASTSANAFSWAYDASLATASDQRTIINGMDNPDHNTRTLLQSQLAQHTLIVSRGSDSNIDPGSADLNSGRSQIRSFDLLRTPLDGWDYATSGTRLGWGLRNSVGVAEHPSTGGLYSVENSADNIQRDNVDVHQTNPGEEMNFHGTLSFNKFAGRGGNYGYPNCFTTWNPAIMPNNKNLRTGTPFANSSSVDYLCRGTIAPRLTFEAHMAPLDIKFNNTGKEGWVTFHGSWNRDNPAGYKVGLIEFANGNPVQKSSSQKAVFEVMKNADNSKCPDDCFRPVGMAFDKSGRLFFSSDRSGEIYVLVKG